MVFDEVANAVCEKCGMHLYCWNTVYNETMDVLSRLPAVFKTKGRICAEDLPLYFSARCRKLLELLSALNICLAGEAARAEAEEDAGLVRSILCRELENTGHMLRSAAENLKNSGRGFGCAEFIRSAFAQFEILVEDSFVSVDSHGRYTVHVWTLPERVGRTKPRELALAVSCAYKRPFADPYFLAEEGRFHMEFRQMPALSASFGMEKICSDGEKLCGDSCECFIDGDFRAIMLLSDGMGCGGPAAVDSNIARSVMSKLLRSGFDFDSAMKTANCAIMLKNGEESFATLDMISIDLFTGTATFMKAGAPQSFIRRGGIVERVMQSSMPVGIVPNTELKKTSYRMSSGDVAVIMSDGALYGEDKWIMSAIKEYDGASPKAFARDIARNAKSLRDDGHTDDITVAVCVIT